MRAIVVKRVSFDAAHFLPNYPGKCKEMHGHHWVVDVGWVGGIDRETGMVIDFSLLKIMLSDILEDLDHHLLNGIIENPTAENIAEYFWDRLGAGHYKWSNATLEFIRVWETEDSYAEVRG